MKFRKIVVHFSFIFLVAFLVTALVSALYGRIVHGACGLNWENAIIFGLIFGIVLTWMEVRKIENSKDEKDKDDPYDA